LKLAAGWWAGWRPVFGQPTALHKHGRAWIRGGAFHVGTGFQSSIASLSGVIAVHTATAFRCAR